MWHSPDDWVRLPESPLSENRDTFEPIAPSSKSSPYLPPSSTLCMLFVVCVWSITLLLFSSWLHKSATVALYRNLFNNSLSSNKYSWSAWSKFKSVDFCLLGWCCFNDARRFTRWNRTCNGWHKETRLVIKNSTYKTLWCLS